MAHLWHYEAAADRWTPMPLEPGASIAGGAAWLDAATTADGPCWVLLSTVPVRVNGDPVAVGMRVLSDRDEIVAGGMRVFFSTEQTARLETYAGGDRPLFCARCKLEIGAGTAVVRCPGCSVLHHQTEELPCWGYTERCAMCDHPTAFDADYRWTPESL